MEAYGVTIWLPEQQELLRGFFHDALGPLVAIRALARFLQDGLTPEKQEVIDVLGGQVDGLRDHLHRLREIVDESDVDVQVPLSVDSSEMAFIVKVAVNTAAAGDQSETQRIHCVIEFDQPVLVPDLLRFRRILTNILTNAVSHTNGPIDLYMRGGHRLLLEVSDRGVGLSGASSSGQGIRIVRELVVSLGGEASWDKRPGGGLITRVTLPLAPIVVVGA